jgi:hypothetical protein
MAKTLVVASGGSVDRQIGKIKSLGRQPILAPPALTSLQTRLHGMSLPKRYATAISDQTELQLIAKIVILLAVY